MNILNSYQDSNGSVRETGLRIGRFRCAARSYYFAKLRNFYLAGIVEMANNRKKGLAIKPG